MPYFMFQWTYTDTAVQAMLNKPQDRPGELRKAVQAFGGKVHQFFFTVGASTAWPSSNSPTTRAAPPAG